METKDTYVLLKRDLFWRPKAEGYTSVLSLAGRYTKGDGIMDGYEILDEYSPKHEYYTPYAIPLSAAPEFTCSCHPEFALKQVLPQRDHLLSVQKQLVEALEGMLRASGPQDSSKPSFVYIGEAQEAALVALQAAKASS